MIGLIAELKGGLCNKLFCLASAIEICLSQGYGLIVPVFGWKRPVSFGEVWNIDRFRAGFPDLCLLESGHEPTIKKTGAELWTYSENKISAYREEGNIPRDAILCRLVQCLEPANIVLHQLNILYTPQPEGAMVEEPDLRHAIAVHIRNEDDWFAYSKKKQPRLPAGEHIWTDVADIYEMCCRQFPGHENWFITCGKPVAFGNKHVYLYDDTLEYEQNAALNWFLCSMAGGGFVGLSRSTFSNLITLRRSLTEVPGGSWIYNYGPNLERRVDAGLQADAEASIKKMTTL